MCRELPGLCTLAQVQQKLSLGLQQCNTQINKSARKRPGWGWTKHSRAADSCKTGCIQETRAAPCCYIPPGSSPVHPPQPTLPTPRWPIMQGKRHRAELGWGILLLWGLTVFDHENMLRGAEGWPKALAEGAPMAGWTLGMVGTDPSCAPSSGVRWKEQ